MGLCPLLNALSLPLSLSIIITQVFVVVVTTFVLLFIIFLFTSFELLSKCKVTVMSLKDILEKKNDKK